MPGKSDRPTLVHMHITLHPFGVLLNCGGGLAWGLRLCIPNKCSGKSVRWELTQDKGSEVEFVVCACPYVRGSTLTETAHPGQAP